MPGDFLRISPCNFDILLIEEVQIRDGFAIIGVFDGIDILHYVYFAHWLGVYLSKS